jgi:Putative transposase/Transposase zinc-binding domain
VGSILRRYGAAFAQQYPQTAAGVVRTLRLLAACRTAALGGHVDRCTHCGEVTYHYHSCGNRHCPQCGGSKRAIWLEQRRAELLPVPYFHVVFTLPHQLSALVLGNRRLLYGLLFEAAAQTLRAVAANPEHLGADIGVLAVLHTWGQQLEHHPHVHCVVPGGGRSADGSRWVACRPNFLLPVNVLGQVFRGKYLAGLRRAQAQGELQWGGSTQALAEPSAWRALLRTLYGLKWVVYAKKPFGGPEQVLKYLTRYTHRVAIGNRRLVRLADDQVTFGWKDYADGCRPKELTLAAVEFVRRFSLHIVPRGLVRIRHYGLLAHRDRRQRLDQCRALLAASAAAGTGPATAEEALGSAPSAAATASPWSATRWRLPLLLAVVLWELSQASRLPAAVVAAGIRSVVQPWAPPAGLCPSCGQGWQQPVWSAERPTAAELERRGTWDSS